MRRYQDSASGPLGVDDLTAWMREEGIWFDVGPDGPDDLRLIPNGTREIPAELRVWAEQHKAALLRIAKKHAERGGNGHGEGTGTVVPLRPERVDPETGEVLSSRALTDYGNAERLVDAHGADLRFCHPFNKWLVYDGRRWSLDNTAEVLRRAKATIRTIYAEAAAAEGGSKEIAKHAIKSEGDARIRAMVGLAQSEAGVPVLPEDLDADPWLLNVTNGTIDLRTGQLRPQCREDLITKTAPVTYDPMATCPTFVAFLERILPSESLRAFVQRAAGYSLTGDTREDVLFINFGGGSNGKSTLMEALLAVVGDYGMQTPTDTLLVKRDEGIPNDVARLKGARMVGAAEAEEGRRLAESRIKQMTGGDRIPARFLHGEWFDFTPTYKLWLSTNHKPIVRGTDTGIWRRIRLIPFMVTISEGERDETLSDKLSAELPGILNWMLAGCLDWQRNGLGMADEVKDATDGYREEMDILGNWIGDCCVTGGDIRASAKSLYISYQQWCESTGERVLPQRTFGMRLGERGYENKRGHGGAYQWHGIALRTLLDGESKGERLNEGEPISDISAREGKSKTKMPEIGSHRSPGSPNGSPHRDTDRALCLTWLESERLEMSVPEHQAASRVLGAEGSRLPSSTDFRARLAAVCGVVATPLEDPSGPPTVSDTGALRVWAEDAALGWGDDDPIPDAMRQVAQRCGFTFDTFVSVSSEAKRLIAWLKNDGDR